MTQLQPFDFDGEQVRAVVGEGGAPLFVLGDVCRALGIANARNVAARLEADDVQTVDVIDSMGRTQQAHAVTESGVIDVTLDSRKPEARRFRRWLTHDVVPQIMKTGRYSAAPALTGPELMASALIEAQRVLDQAHRQIEADRPKVVFADAVSTSQTNILVGDLAKILRGNGVEVGAVRLFEWLRRDGYLIRRKGTDWNMPTQRSMELGLFRVKETAVTHSDGHVTISKTPKVTGKGQTYFINRYVGAEVSA